MAILLTVLAEGKRGGGPVRKGHRSKGRERGNVPVHYSPYVIFMGECASENLPCS